MSDCWGQRLGVGLDHKPTPRELLGMTNMFSFLRVVVVTSLYALGETCRAICYKEEFYYIQIIP